MSDQVFIGFENPKANYSKLPHSLIESLWIIDSLAEMKVILYVLRHTWGYQEYHEAKRITMDEFEQGRKSKGKRMDNGTGMVRNSIKAGINQAIQHGFLIQEEDTKDAGRSSYVYYLNIIEEDTPSKVDPVPPQKLTPRGSKVDPRSEKETKKETIERMEEEEVVAAVFRSFEQEIGLLTPMVGDEIEDLIEEHTAQWVIASFREASMRGKRSLGYCKAILKRWAVDGYGSEFKLDVKHRGGGGGTSPPIHPLQAEIEKRRREGGES